MLQVNSNPVIPVTLQLGSLEETVSVEASAPLVETRNPAIGAVIENEAVEALPLEGRNPTALIALAGAAVDTGAPGSRSMTTSRRISDPGRPGVGRRVSARRGDAQQLVRRRQPAAAVPRRAAGVPGGNQLAERGERDERAAAR